MRTTRAAKILLEKQNNLVSEQVGRTRVRRKNLRWSVRNGKGPTKWAALSGRLTENTHR